MKNDHELDDSKLLKIIREEAGAARGRRRGAGGMATLTKENRGSLSIARDEFGYLCLELHPECHSGHFADEIEGLKAALLYAQWVLENSSPATLERLVAEGANVDHSWGNPIDGLVRPAKADWEMTQEERMRSLEDMVQVETCDHCGQERP